MRRHSTATLMGMTKQQLVQYVRMAEHNQEVAEAALDQQAKNLKDWVPGHPDLALAMLAGARAIEVSPRFAGSSYVRDPFGEHGAPQELSYYSAAKLLREQGERLLEDLKEV